MASIASLTFEAPNLQPAPPAVGKKLFLHSSGELKLLAPDGGIMSLGNGVVGINGREVQLQKSTTHIQWRYVGDLTWSDLVALNDLKGADGNAGAAGTDGNDGADAVWNFTGAYNLGLPYAVGDIATYLGETWYRKNSNGGNVGDTPAEGTFWTLIAQKGGKGDTGAVGPAPSGTGIVTVINGVLQTPKTLSEIGAATSAQGVKADSALQPSDLNPYRTSANQDKLSIALSIAL
jgi:hypothetical protein